MLRYSSSDAGDEPVPAVDPSEGWIVWRPKTESSGPSPSYWCAQIRRDLYQLGLRDYWDRPSVFTQADAPVTQLQWRTIVQSAVRNREEACWWSAVQQRPILRTYLTIRQPSKLQLQSYLTVPYGGWNDRIRLGRVTLTQLRCGTNQLRINTGRYDGTPESQRVCWMCAKGVEDEQHFLLDCQQFAAERMNLWNRIDRIVDDGRLADADEHGDAPMEPPFRSGALSRIDRSTLLMTGSHPNIVGYALQRQVTSAILIAIAQWINEREQHFDRLKRADAARLA